MRYFWLIGLLLALTPQRGRLPDTNQVPQADQRGTKASPLIVQTLDSGERERQASERTKAREEQATTDFRTVFIAAAMLLVAIAQAVLFVVQLRYMRDSLRDTKAAADAASDSASAAVVGQRAFVFLSTTPTMEDNKERPMIHGSLRPLKFANFGATPARIDSITASCRRWPKGELESLTAQPDGKKVVAYAVWLAGNGAALGIQHAEVEATTEDIQRAKSGDGVIALVGHLNYTDVFNKPRDVGFAYFMDGIKPVNMREVPNSKLNYST